MQLNEEHNAFNRLLNRLVAYKEMFTIDGYFIQPQLLHISRVDGGEKNPWHSHHSYEYSFVLDGRISYYVNQTCASLQAGDSIIIPANMMHRWDMHEPSLIFSMAVHFSFNGEGARRRMGALLSGLQKQHYHFRNFTEGFDVVNRLQNALREHRGFLNEKIRYYSREMVIALFDKILTPRQEATIASVGDVRLRGSTGKDLLEALQFFINDNIYRRLTVKDLAAYIGISVNHMNGILKKQANLTANELLWQRKIFYACQLLNTTNRQVKDIASSVGVEDVSYFCRRFRAFTGSSPAAFRLGKRR